MARTPRLTAKLSQLDDTRRRIDQWRETRPHGHAPMPATLWRSAVVAARRHGLYTTARTLRVDYGALKKHLDAATADAGSGPGTFIELAAADASIGASDGLVCVIELVTPRWTKRIRLTGLGTSDVAALAQMAWSQAQ